MSAVQQILTSRDLCRELDVPLTTLLWNARRHGIGRKIGRDWLFAKEDIERFRQVLRRKRGNPNGWRKAHIRRRAKKKVRELLGGCDGSVQKAASGADPVAISEVR